MPDHIAQPTQVRRPWRTTVRSVFQGIVGFAPVLPLIVAASGIDQTIPAVAGGVALSGAIVRVMALPAVERFLLRYAPWLAADPVNS